MKKKDNKKNYSIFQVAIAYIQVLLHYFISKPSSLLFVLGIWLVLLIVALCVAFIALIVLLLSAIPLLLSGVVIHQIYKLVPYTYYLWNHATDDAKLETIVAAFTLFVGSIVAPIVFDIWKNNKDKSGR